jgi:hypothetical protein
MRKTFDVLDVSIIALIGVLLGLFMGGALSTHYSKPIIAALEVELIELQELVDTCPETMECYEPYGSPVEPEYILKGTVVKVNFVSEDELAGNEVGYAEYRVYGNVSVCHITAMLPEKILGDPRMDTLGHELLHCIAGSFHP